VTARERAVAHVTELVRAAPALDDAVVTALVDDLRAIATPLALAIARIAELVGEQLVDAGIALPALAMACDTLARSTDPTALAAAQDAVETLQPMPDRDLIPAATLSRGPRSRT
jgi:hypothetical protein